MFVEFMSFHHLNLDVFIIQFQQGFHRKYLQW
jgi:hypothetical protein